MKAIVRNVMGFFTNCIRGRRDDPRLPSLVRAIHALAPRSVAKEVLGLSNDRRQWGVLTAAWLGVAEHEFMEAAARSLKIGFRERIPHIELKHYGADAEQVLADCRTCGVVPVWGESSVVELIAVDPAEARRHRLFDPLQEVAIGCWSRIAAVLDAAERDLREAVAVSQRAESDRRDELSKRVAEIIMAEAAAHNALSVEIVATDDIARYQFTTPDGSRGHGNINRAVISAVLHFLSRLDGKHYQSETRGEVLVRSLGSSSGFRLTWADKTRALPQPDKHAPDLLVQPEVNDLQSKTRHHEIAPSSPEELQPRLQLMRWSNAELEAKEARIPVMVVDDNPMFCRVLERLLVRDGYAPIFAAHGEEALSRLEEIQSEMPRLIVSDLHMPVMNGREFICKLKNDSRYGLIPVIALTSDDDVEAELTLLGIGIDAFVSKARDPRVLCAQIRRLVAARSTKAAA